MPDIEPITRRKFSQADRAAVQEQIARAVEANPGDFLAAYPPISFFPCIPIRIS